MKYPLRGEYDTAIRNIDRFVFDNILKVGSPVKQKTNNGFLRSYNGGKATVYEIQTSTKKYALKCWVENLGDLKNRYKAIDEYLQKSQLSYFVDFSYNEKGILVNGEKFPIVRMEWVDGISFKTFISNNIINPIFIRNFAEDFLDMVKTLHQNSISHGDLQHGNIIIGRNSQVYLIDYDSLYVPSLSNEKDNIKGLPGYQHPARNKLVHLSPKSDYFSELVIYLSLIIISENPNCWPSIEKEERLIFSENDFTHPNSSKVFAELSKMSPEVQYYAMKLIDFCKELNIERLCPLENIVAGYTGSKVNWDFIPNTNPNLSSPPTNRLDSPNFNWDEVTIPPPSRPNQENNSSTPNIWDKLDNNKSGSSNIWDKLDNSKPGSANVWDKLDNNKPGYSNTPVGRSNNKLESYLINKSGGLSKQKNKNIWDKFKDSISSVWNKFVNWLK